MQRPLHVISVAYTDAVSDPRVRRHCESLARRGHRVVQIGLGARSEAAVGRLGDVVLVRSPQVRYRGRQLWRYVFGYVRFLIFARAVVRTLARRRRVDVVQVTNLPDFLVLAAGPARAARAGVVLDIRDPMPELFASKFGRWPLARLGVRLLTWHERWASRRCDVLVTVNEAHRRATLRHGVAPDRIRVVLNAADENAIPGCAPAERIEPRLVYHGTVARRMGLEVVIDAVARLRAGGVPAVLDVYGDGDAVAALRRHVADLQLQDAVSISGRRQPMRELVPLIRRASIAVVPMVADAFTNLVLPSKLIEYVRLGVPAIVSRTPTVAAYFDETMVRYLDELSPEGVARAVEGVLSDPARAVDRARRAQGAEAAQPWQHFEPAYLEMVEALAPERRAGDFSQRAFDAGTVSRSARAARLSRG